MIRPERICALVLVVCLIPCLAFSDPNPNSDNDRRRWITGAGLLESGRNVAAERFFADWWANDPSSVPAALGRIEAAGRYCALPAVFEHMAIGAQTGPAQANGIHLVLEGEQLRQANKLTEAADLFAQAADLAEARSDTLAWTQLLLASALCHLNNADLDRVTAQAQLATELLADKAHFPALQMTARRRFARIRHMAGDFAVADSLYNRILIDAEAAGLTGTLCDANNERGANFSRQRKTANALPDYKRALGLARQLGDQRRVARVLLNLAYEETQIRALDAARTHLNEAADIADDCGFEYLVGSIHGGLGAIAETDGDRLGAIREFRAGALAHAAYGNKMGELAGRQRLGYSLLMDGQYKESLQQYERCLDMLEDRQSPMILNWVLAGLALTNHRLGYLDRAEVYYRQAMDVNEGWDDRLSVAWCLNSISMLETMRGNYRQALVLTGQARDVFREVNNVEGEGNAYAAMGAVYFELGDWEKAQEHYAQAAALAETSGDEELLQDVTRGWGVVCAAAGQPGLAEDHCRRSLELSRKWSDNVSEISSLLGLADICLKTRRPAEARSLLEEAEALLKDDGHYVQVSELHQLLARCMDDPVLAIAHLRQALAAAEIGSLPEREWSCLADLGQAQMATGDTLSAQGSFLRSIEVVESLRRNVGSDDLRRHMLRPALTPYERLIHLLLTSGQPASEALSISERSRAQILAARLRAAFAGGDSEPTGQYGAKERELLATIGFYQAQLQDAALTAIERQETRRRIDETEDAFNLLRLQMANHYVDYTNDAYPDAAETENLAGVLRPDEQALSWFLGEGASFLFHIRAGGVSAYPLPPKAVIEEKVKRYLRLRHGVASAEEKLPASLLTTSSGELYRLLIEPAVPQLVDCQKLILVPDGLLHRLPFAALSGLDGPLVSRFELSLVPSLRTLGYLRRRHEDRQLNDPVRSLDLMAVGYGGQDDRPEGGDRRINPFSDAPVVALPNAEAEVWEVADLFYLVNMLTGQSADEGAFKQSPVSEAEVLHFATHSYSDDRDVRRSYLLLAPTEGPNPQDGLLQWPEIAALDLNASLVSLAACRSAGGVLAVGEGMTGLSQAFLHAGATSVLAAQTDIPDHYARHLMLQFYRHLSEGQAAATALRLVQLAEMSEDTPEAEAQLWADFQISGDGSIAITSAQPAAQTLVSPLWLVVAVALLITAVLYRRLRRPSK